MMKGAEAKMWLLLEVRMYQVAGIAASLEALTGQDLSWVDTVWSEEGTLARGEARRVLAQKMKEAGVYLKDEENPLDASLDAKFAELMAYRAARREALSLGRRKDE